MTRYVITGRPIGPIVEEITHLGVGASLDADLTPEREAELIDARILRIDETQQEEPDNGSSIQPDPEPVGAAEPDSSGPDSQPEPAEQPVTEQPVIDGDADAAADAEQPQ